MKNLILATIISSSLLIADNGVALPEYDLVKKDFINGEINNERLSQIILKDPRLVPRSRGGLKDDVDASSDGLGVLVIGKFMNGNVKSFNLNGQSGIDSKLNYLIERYGENAKNEGISVLDYVKDGIENGHIIGAEADAVIEKLSRDDIIDIELTPSNNNPVISDIVTITSNALGNYNNSILNYEWNVPDGVNIENDNGDNLIISFSKPGSFDINLKVIDPDGNFNKNLNLSINVNSASNLEQAYSSTSFKAEGWVNIDSNLYHWDSPYWKNDNETIVRYSKIMDKGLKLENVIVSIDRFTGVERTFAEFQDGSSAVQKPSILASIFVGGLDFVSHQYYECTVPNINDYVGNSRTKFKCKKRVNNGHIDWHVQLNDNFCDYITNGQGNYTLVRNVSYPNPQKRWNGISIYSYLYSPPTNHEWFECVDLTSGCINGFTENIDGKCEALLPL
jgi:hypothetical protein